LNEEWIQYCIIPHHTAPFFRSLFWRLQAQENFVQATLFIVVFIGIAMEL
jgi:hypothetical protein